MTLSLITTPIKIVLPVIPVEICAVVEAEMMRPVKLASTPEGSVQVRRSICGVDVPNITTISVDDATRPSGVVVPVAYQLPIVVQFVSAPLLNQYTVAGPPINEPRLTVRNMVELSCVELATFTVTPSATTVQPVKLRVVVVVAL